MSRHTGHYAYPSSLPTGEVDRADSDRRRKDASQYPTTSAYPDPPAQVGHPSYVPSHSSQRRESTCMSAPARHQPQDTHQYQPTSALAITPSSYRPMGMNENPQRHMQTDQSSTLGRDRRASDASSMYGSSPLSRTSSSNFGSASLSSSYGSGWSMQQPSGSTRRPSIVSRPSADDDDDRMYGWQRDHSQTSNRHQMPGTTPSVIEEDDDDEMYDWRRQQRDQNRQSSNPTNRRR